MFIKARFDAVVMVDDHKETTFSARSHDMFLHERPTFYVSVPHGKC